ncbi:MAG: hypothetical protein JTT11_08725, partial [Candidatus Brockarchaeota archaeon]|nr:hypothetical protein [Candidatus Brockarchaeota archaeon]
MDPVEGFFVEDARGNVFAVKGLLHPRKKLVVVPRYVPSGSGDRSRRGASYLKLGSSAYKLSMDRWPRLRRADPYLGVELLEMDEGDVEKVHDPVSKLEELRREASTPLQKACVFLSSALEKGGVDGRMVGVTGSILVGLEKGSSDVDLVVYGLADSARAYEAMRRLRLEGLTAPASGKARNPMGLPAGIQEAHEARKLLKGELLLGSWRVGYLLRCIPLKEEYVERYGEARHADAGALRLEADVVDDKFGYLVPTRYSVQIQGSGKRVDVVSYGGVICEQARKGEKALVSGK